MTAPKFTAKVLKSRLSDRINLLFGATCYLPSRNLSRAFLAVAPISAQADINPTPVFMLSLLCEFPCFRPIYLLADIMPAPDSGTARVSCQLWNTVTFNSLSGSWYVFYIFKSIPGRDILVLLPHELRTGKSLRCMTRSWMMLRTTGIRARRLVMS